MKNLCALLFICSLLASSVFANLVANPGFETPESTCGGCPSTYGDWLGDYSTIVTATAGITPYEGSRMLQLQGSGWSTSKYAARSEVAQIINVTPYISLIRAGKAVLNASIYVNRVAGDAQTDTEMGFYIYAHAGSPSQYPIIRDTRTNLAEASTITDDLAGTWQLCQISVAIPIDIDFIVIDVWANENIYNNTTGTEFDGHFVDSVSVAITPEPGTLLMLAFGGLLLRKKN